MQSVSNASMPHSQVWEKAKEDLLPAIGNEILGFCSCAVGTVERREWFTDRVVEDITRNFKDKSSPLVYVAFACGGLANDYLILSRLVDEGYTNFEIHLIDPAFPKLKKSNERQIFERIKAAKLKFLSEGGHWSPLKEIAQQARDTHIRSQAGIIKTLFQKCSRFGGISPIANVNSEMSERIYSLNHLIQRHNFEVLLKAKGVKTLDISHYLSAKDYLEKKASKGHVFVLIDPCQGANTSEKLNPCSDIVNCLKTPEGVVFSQLSGELVSGNSKLNSLLEGVKDIEAAKIKLSESKIKYQIRSDIRAGFSDVAVGNSADKALFYILDDFSDVENPDSIKVGPEGVAVDLLVRSQNSMIL